MITLKKQYEGEVVWHEGNPPKRGVYLATLPNGEVDIVRFYNRKDNMNFITTTYLDEGECYYETPRIKGWAYIPNPYGTKGSVLTYVKAME